MSQTEEQARISKLLTRLDMGEATGEELQSAFALVLRQMWSRDDMVKMISEEIAKACQVCTYKRDWFALLSKVVTLPWFWGFLSIAIFSPNFPRLLDFVTNIAK